MAARQDRSSILRFARVSRNTSTWVLPIFYTTLYLHTKSLSRLIRKYQNQQKSPGTSGLKPLHLQYPTTSLIITGPSPDLWWLSFFSKRFPDIRRIAFETTGKTEANHVGGLFWQIIAEVNGPQIVSFRLPSTATQAPSTSPRFGGFGTPRFQNTTHLALNWITLGHFDPLPEGVRLKSVFPVLHFLFVQCTENAMDGTIALLKKFSRLETLKKIGISSIFSDSSDGFSSDDENFFIFLMEQLQPYEEKLVGCNLKGWEFDPIFEKKPFDPDHFEALDEVWKEMNGGEEDIFKARILPPPTSNSKGGLLTSQALMVKSGSGTMV
ncbi:hypothetical protein DL96DRAFT_1581088 [Flagelloscypha sp. PMI_526]|nr:hypothetical protein DL96DRAFT_1581088 [Flagelloscypha sp. PMI_526]